MRTRTRCGRLSGIVLQMTIFLGGWLAPLPSRLSPAIAQPDQPARAAPGPVLVRVSSVPEDQPLGAVLVRLGNRYSASSAAGEVTFDGVPAGTYPLVVEQVGFERLERKVELAPGRREPVAIQLTPVVQARLSGEVRLANTSLSVPGARVVLTPVAVPAAIQGRFEFTTDWTGKFTVFELPPGQYGAEVTMPGCTPLARNVDVRSPATDVQFTLEREVRPAALIVIVQDAVTQAAIAGAEVVLAEAWPRGRIAAGRTDPGGRAEFLDLATGRLNWADQSEAVTVSRRQITMHVEAPGYEPTLRLLTLQEKTEVHITANPTTKLVEHEPDNDLATAQPIRTGVPLELKIDPVGDRDFFRFRLEQPAFLEVTLGPKNPFEIHLGLLGIDGQAIATVIGFPGQEAVIRHGVLAGEYFVEVGQRYNGQASPELLTLLIKCTTASDPLEPNDTPEQARLVRGGEEIRGTILPKGDLDHYRFEMARPGMVRFSSQPYGLERLLAISDAAGKTVASIVAYANQPAELVAPLRAGWHIFAVQQRYHASESVDPYVVRLDVAEDDGFDDPPERPGHISAVRSLPLSGVMGATINPIGDVDLFALPTPSAGLLRVRLVSPVESLVQVRSADGRTLAGTMVFAERPGGLVWSAPGSTIGYLEVRQRYNAVRAASPYTLQTWWEPGDEYEFMERNDGPRTATPVTPGEVLRGNITPVGDVDWYRLELSHPAYLQINGLVGVEALVRIHDGRLKKLSEAVFYPAGPGLIGADLPAGTCYVEVRQRYDAISDVGAYNLRTTLSWAEPVERAPLVNDPVRLLKLGEAQSFKIDQIGDRDRFEFSVPQAGKFGVAIVAPEETLVTLFDDLAGKPAGEWIAYPGRPDPMPVTAAGPARYRLELRRRYDARRFAEDGYVLVDSQSRPISITTVAMLIEPEDPTLATFTRQPHPAGADVQNVQIDADGDGQIDVDLAGRSSGTFRYRAEGIYSAIVHQAGTNGTTTLSRQWVTAIGPHERKGIYLAVDYPAEGQIIEGPAPCRVRAISYENARIVDLSVAVDGQPIANAYAAPFVLDVPWETLGRGRHEVAVAARDARGNRATVKRLVTVSEYFGLLPEDGTMLSGDNVRVSWTGPQFGSVKVRYRLPGAADWQESIGENGHRRSVVLANLEAGQAYEFQPVGDGEPGPVRTVTRVKGLAFGRARYGVTINRDYDQRVAISVRNHAEQAMTVQLECGQPADAALLVGFVGEGSQGAPFDLAPGEEREFLLGISAQDVVRPQHAFPVRIHAENGFSDEAEVAVTVKLPVVKLQWEEVGPTPTGMGRILRLRNQGDPLTDLRVAGSKEDLLVTPAVDHGLIRAGQTLEFSVRPRFYEGFLRCEGAILAQAFAETVEHPVAFALEAGQQVFAVELSPASGAGEPPTNEQPAPTTQHAPPGVSLRPQDVDWSRCENPRDVDSDGRPDLWSVEDETQDVLWVGDDTNGDGKIDQAGADLGRDGFFDYVAYRTAEGWTDQLPAAGVTPSSAPADGESEGLLKAARLLGCAFLNPDAVDWKQRRQPEDVDGDDRPDRWRTTDRAGSILWLGDDTDRDGEIDFVHADVDGDGQYEYSAFKTPDGWQETNLVEAWLEMGFTLPWARHLYEKHDLDVVVNGVVVAELRDLIPEGNYTFRVPPAAVKMGPGEKNQVEIRSAHLRGGHYVVNSDFRFKVRLTGTSMWVVAGSREEAQQIAGRTEGLSLKGCDYSVSSSEVRLEPPSELKTGTKAMVLAVVRNIGASTTPDVPVALLAGPPGGKAVEVARTLMRDVPLVGFATAQIPWTAAAGTLQLRVVVDPDRKLDDLNRANNVAMITTTSPGDDAPPTLRILEPTEGATLTQPVFRLRAEAKDDAGIARVEARVDGGLWQPLLEAEPSIFCANGLLQRGSRVLTVRATDVSGREIEQAVRLTVQVGAPEVSIAVPADGATMESRTAKVELKCGPTVVLAGVRVNGGPWRRADLAEGRAVAHVALEFGEIKLEALAADGQGAVAVVGTKLRCSRQAEAATSAPALSRRLEEGVFNLPGLGPVDLFGATSTLVPGAGAAAESGAAVEAEGGK